MTIIIDVFIIKLVSTRKCFSSPMYFFLKNFLYSEIVVVTLIVPNMLRVIWLKGATISIPCCIAQSYLYCASASTECYLLAVMSYDRYLAICKPLLYNKIMSQSLQHNLVVFCWVFGFLLTLITLYLLSQLEFCGPNTINHYFCDLAPIVELACSDTSVIQIEILILSIPIIVTPFISVVTSYVYVLVAILGMSSNTGRKKAFSTCSSHLSVVGMFYGTLVIIYVVPSKGHLQSVNKVISVLYTVITPLFNPFIYSIRNKDIRDAMSTQSIIKWVQNKM
ncbi:olfactory receptor 11L1-like [Mantella aurantiaca]